MEETFLWKRPPASTALRPSSPLLFLTNGSNAILTLPRFSSSSSPSIFMLGDEQLGCEVEQFLAMLKPPSFSMQACAVTLFPGHNSFARNVFRLSLPKLLMQALCSPGMRHAEAAVIWVWSKKHDLCVSEPCHMNHPGEYTFFLDHLTPSSELFSLSSLWLFSLPSGYIKIKQPFSARNNQLCINTVLRK